MPLSRLEATRGDLEICGYSRQTTIFREGNMDAPSRNEPQAGGDRLGVR